MSVVFMIGIVDSHHWWEMESGIGGVCGPSSGDYVNCLGSDHSAYYLNPIYGHVRSPIYGTMR